jgi:hypothetical protein
MTRPSILLAALVALCARIATAETIQVPVTGLQGSYTHGGYRAATFSLGSPVDSVRSVVIRCSGTAQTGLLCVGGPLCGPTTCNPWISSLYSDIDSDEGHALFAGLSNLDGSFVAADTFHVVMGDSWESVLDGSGTLKLGIMPVALLPECQLQPESVSPLVIIDSVTLIFDVVVSATPVSRRTWGQLKSHYRRGSPAAPPYK